MTIHITGAREHNLQNIDVHIPDGLTVVTGVSGSGKTSLVFDTLYHEARRRFDEIFSVGNRGGRLAPADVESITGLGPTVAVGQNLLNRNPNSTLATVSGLHPLLRLLYARFGERACASCGAAISVLSQDERVERLVALSACPMELRVPLVHRTVGSHRTLLALLAEQFGSKKLRIDGAPHFAAIFLNPAIPHDIDLILARTQAQLTISNARTFFDQAASFGAHALTVVTENATIYLSATPVCINCGHWFSRLEPVHFNTACPHCNGDGCTHCAQTGLHPQAAATRWQNLTFPDFWNQSVEQAYYLVTRTEDPLFSPHLVTPRLRSEITRRLDALRTVGLGYIALNRPAPTLSRGEAQRVRLAVSLTSRLEDVLHVLDEPTVGLHPADVRKLLPAFRQLPGPVILVEHDRMAAAAADHIFDIGPGAGQGGGRLVFSGTPADLWQADTPTGRYFSLRESVDVPDRRPLPDEFFTVHNAHLRNLQGIEVPIALGRLTVITGVSGSGKSTFVEDVLAASLKAGRPIGCEALDGRELKPVIVDQDPIGRNPRSNPATYTKLADILRDYFSAETGLSTSYFSFNRAEGACPTCDGMGAVEVKMRYLPSTWILCDDCQGRRFSDDVLSARIELAGERLSIADVYELSIAQAHGLLVEREALPGGLRGKADRLLTAMSDIGLGYLKLGQPSPTLSGGEAQRIKLACHLGRRNLTKELLILDEPSTGLHPQDVSGLLVVLDCLVRAGATVVVVEHNTDIIRAADWAVDLGPGAGPSGGQVLFAGPAPDLVDVSESLTGQSLSLEETIKPDGSRITHRGSRPSPPASRLQSFISIRNAHIHNLKNVDVSIPKGTLTVVTGVSGSGKSSLVSETLELEARRRYLESLSMYERQGVREGAEAQADSVSGLGVTVAVRPRHGRFDRRITVGVETEIAHHLAVLLAWIGERRCTECATAMQRDESARTWTCLACGASAQMADPRHFSPSTYAAACTTCQGVGTLQIPAPEKLIIHPDKPLTAGAMYSPGFFPQGYLGKPFNGGYDMVRALAARYDFDPATMPWNQMSETARQAFLFGDREPLEVTYITRNRTRTETQRFPGFYGWVRDWDVGGTYTNTQPCSDCGGARLRPDYLAVTLAGHNIHQLSQLSLAELRSLIPFSQTNPSVLPSLRTIEARLRFLCQVGLGYLHLDRVAATLSAGEAQRIKLAGLLGSGLTNLTLLLDEPTRGQHSSEVHALLDALHGLRDGGNTVIVVEHDLDIIRAADHLIDVGPGAGTQGGTIVAQGAPADVAKTDSATGRWLRPATGPRITRPASRITNSPLHHWLSIHGARENNLRNLELHLPLGLLTGVCGVSGSGKSTLIVDILGRALAPKKQTTSVAYEPIEPGAHDAIDGAPARTIVVDQSRAGVVSPATFLGLDRLLRKLFSESEDAQLLGLDEKALGRSCSACKGQGRTKLDMGFLPPVYSECEACRGSGMLAEAREVKVKGKSLQDVYELTLSEAGRLFADEEKLSRLLVAANDVGLGYLVLRQPGHALSGGEAQRLKIAKELSRPASLSTLYILDEPTLGQHMQDVTRLIGVLNRLVDAGHSVLVVEHHPMLLAACDWLVELGPGGGPNGGEIIAQGTPAKVAAGNTPTASCLREWL